MNRVGNAYIRCWRDPGVTNYGMRRSIWVVCPHCCGPASSMEHEAEQRFRLVCRHCAHTAELPIFGTVESMGDSTDGRFGLPLYLTASVRGHQLWVYNLKHIDALAVWLGAALRERPSNCFHRNRTMMSRLPRWMSSASSRPHMMKALAKLRDRPVKEGLG